MTRKSASCPYCRSAAKFGFKIYGMDYFRCPQCDLIFKGGSGEKARTDLIGHFATRYFRNSAHDQLSGSRDSLYRHIIEDIEGKTDRGWLLDVGCGCGLFLKEACDKGWQISGIDPSHESVAHAEGILGIPVFQGTLIDYPGGVFDVITLINVLDHSPEPWRDVEKARTMLGPGGLLYLRFPNGRLHALLLTFADSLHARTLMEKYLIFHEYSFTPRFIHRLLDRAGFGEIEIRNARLSGGETAGWFLKALVRVILKYGSPVSPSGFLFGPSLEVTARKKT